jgi:hypothetical protein
MQRLLIDFAALDYHLAGNSVRADGMFEARKWTRRFYLSFLSWEE